MSRTGREGRAGQIYETIPDEISKSEPQVTTKAIDPLRHSASGNVGLDALGLVECLDGDERPIFVLDLKVHPNTRTIPVYQNASLQTLGMVGVAVSQGTGAQENKSSVADSTQTRLLLDWALSKPELVNLPPSIHWGMRWTARTVRCRWRIVVGEVGSLPEEGTQPPPIAATERGRSGQKIKPTERPRRPSRPSLSAAHNTLEKQLAAFRLVKEDTLTTFPSQRDTTHGRDIDVQITPTIQNSETLSAFDVTRPHPDIKVSSHIAFFQNFDWSTTELGPMSSWSLELRRMCNLVMCDPRPAALYWGPSKTMMYNNHYVHVTGKKHPGIMGKTFAEAWEEVAADFEEPFAKAYESGYSFAIEDARFYINRNGYLEETYYTVSIIPLLITEGQIAFYNPIIDTTRQVITDRRMAFLLLLSQYISSSREPKDFWQQLVRCLQIDHMDLPFALLYSAGWDVNETLSESSEQSHAMKNWVLEGLVRVDQSSDSETTPKKNTETNSTTPENKLTEAALKGIPSADNKEDKTPIPRRFTTEESMEEFLPHFPEMVRADTPTLLSVTDGTFPLSLAKHLNHPDRDVHYNAAVFLPIKSTGDSTTGFLILGVNPWKAYDADYKGFIELLSRQLASSMAAALLFEDEIRRGRMVAEQADRDRYHLSTKLAIQTQAASQTENRFRNMADLSPAGQFHISPSGVLVYANNEYYRLTGHPRNVSHPMSWYDVLLEDDHELMDLHWGKLLSGEATSFEIRLKHRFEAEEVVGGEKVQGYTWVIAAAYAEKNINGEVVGILGCLTDISRQKWAEGFQNRRMLEAVELKKQQENFIDMTSHEMRNPLSAIIQCADWICNLSEFDAGTNDVTVPREVIDSYADAAQTILLCAQHQKRIIDDILTLSKLDSDLLFITPVEVQPLVVIQNAVRMFDGELQKCDVELRVRVEESFRELDVDWVTLDPSRLLQVFINLITNAIKFTQTEENRKIQVFLGASTQRPESQMGGLQYLGARPRAGSVRHHSSERLENKSMKAKLEKEEVIISNEKDKEEEWVYITVAVQDTGRGLGEDEKNRLFKRFSQASVRTHVQYGGNGLGLFISRRLTELQGGQIGVASESGVGSTFAFYVHARRCAAPEPSRTSTPVDFTSQTRLIHPSALERIANDPGIPRGEDERTTETKVLKEEPKHILIVEDNIVNQKVLCKQLRSVGCVVSVANHGVEALAFIEGSTFWSAESPAMNSSTTSLPSRGSSSNRTTSAGVRLDIILMDLEMPVMDGLTCVKRIRQLEREGKIRGHIPVIAVTANARSEQIAHAREEGMDSVVTKPFRIPELMRGMEGLLGNTGGIGEGGVNGGKVGDLEGERPEVSGRSVTV